LRRTEVYLSARAQLLLPLQEEGSEQAVVRQQEEKPSSVSANFRRIADPPRPSLLACDNFHTIDTWRWQAALSCTCRRISSTMMIMRASKIKP
jgi:hypothetical protein